jgi:DNA-binding transcriptional LysR family regulator
MEVRHLEYFVALAREQHFSRAARTCHVTQATLSNGITRLEHDLQAQLVDRGQRFRGLTVEGERALVWAQRIVSDFSALRDDMRERRRDVTGSITIGVVPSAVPPAAVLTELLTHKYPGISAVVRSASADDIARGLTSGAYHAGVTYLSTASPASGLTVPLYHERYDLITTREAWADRDNVSWRDVASLPLCLLGAHLQPRRRIDEQFAQAGVLVRPRAEVDSFDGVLSHVVLGGYSSVIPHAIAILASHQPTIRVIPMVEPSPSFSMGLMVERRESLTPPVSALVAIAAHVDLDGWLQAAC